MNQSIKEALAEVAETYATVQGLLNTRTKSGAWRGNVWIEKLDSTNPLQVDMVCNVLHEIADLTLRPVPPGETLDMLPFHVAAEATRRRVKLEDRHHQEMKYHKPTREARLNRMARMSEAICRAGGKDDQQST